MAPTETNGNTMVAPLQPSIDASIDVATLQRDAGAHLLEALQMQIDRASADGAAAGQRHARLADARQQRTEHKERGPHLADDVVGRLGIGNGAPEGQRAAVIGDRIDHDAVLLQ